MIRVLHLASSGSTILWAEVNLQMNGEYDGTFTILRTWYTRKEAVMPFDRKKFDSTNLDEGQYDAGEKTLVLTFKNGTSYQYYGVSQDIWDELKTAPSKGKYFNAHIRGKFAEARL